MKRLSQLKAYKKIILLILLVVITLILTKCTSLDQPSFLKFTFRDMLAPVQNIVSELGHRIKEVVSFPFDLIDAVQKYEKLAEDLEVAEGELNQMEEFYQENKRLKELLQFQSTVTAINDYELVSAPIVARNFSNWFGTVWIGAGENEGIENNMTVVSPSGLVGRIISVTENASEVLLVTDSRSGVSAFSQKGRVPGVVKGVLQSSGNLVMEKIDINSTVNEEEIIVTAGLGLYLKGIPIGKVSLVAEENSGLYKKAELTPLVNFNRLEEVIVIKAQLGDELDFNGLDYSWNDYIQE